VPRFLPFGGFAGLIRLNVCNTQIPKERKTMEIILSWYNVKNLEESKKYYGETLGMKKILDSPNWVEFSHAQGAAAIGLLQGPTNGGDGGATVVFRVKDLDAKMRDLAGRGVHFEGKVEEVPGAVRIATFRDPSGNRLQLVQPLAQR
jgi:predicted enzyme related to lactoylglutathione lyase